METEYVYLKFSYRCSECGEINDCIDVKKSIFGKGQKVKCYNCDKTIITKPVN